MSDKGIRLSTAPKCCLIKVRISSMREGCPGEERMPHAVQYTLILCASKKMPKQCVDYLTGQSKSRRTVGIRIPGDPICQVLSSVLLQRVAALPL